MPIYTIPPEDWEQFCQEFSAQHAGAAITVELLSGSETDPGVERTIVARSCPLHSLRIERGAGEDLLVFLGRDLESGPQFVIAPRELRLEQPDAEENGRLRVQTADGQTLLLHIPAPVLPGQLNGA